MPEAFTILPGRYSFEPYATTAARIKAVLIWFSVAGVTYALVQRAALALHPAPAPAFRSALDAMLPTVPASLIAYLSLGAFVLLPAFTVDARTFRRLLRAGLVAMVIAYSIFLIAPLLLERGPLPDASPWRQLMALTHLLDQPVNTFPSLHVAYATLVIICRRWSWWVWLWWAAIVVSTVMTRQHVVADVAGGMFLAACCWAVTHQRTHHHQNELSADRCEGGA